MSRKMDSSWGVSPRFVGTRCRHKKAIWVNPHDSWVYSLSQGCSKVIYETIKQHESITEELLRAGHNTDDAHQELWDPLDSAE